MKHPGKFILGVTGSFGTGKSTVSGFFKELGAKVVDADGLAHEALQKGSPVFQAITKALGPEILDSEGAIDRSKVARLIFRDAGCRKQLEALVHPYVFQRITEEIRKAKEAIVVVEIPLLFETASRPLFDAALVVKAAEVEVGKRLRKKGFDASEIRAREKSQMPLEEKLKLADYVIDNNHARETTRQQVVKVWETIAH